MWEQTRKKIEQLDLLDKQRQVFGAQSHDYRLYPTLTTEEISQFENWLGAPFPGDLQAFYREVGNGVAGPHYGLLEAGAVTGYRPGEIYTDAAKLRAMSGDGSRESEDGYFEVNKDSITGLMTIIDEGCGHETCLITTGPRAGEVVHVSIEGYVHETGKKLIEVYERWLDHELGKFEAVRKMMIDGSTLDEISSTVVEQFRSYDAEDIIVSIADVEKPVELFGTEHHRIYHGASQTPWYESVLRKWRETQIRE